MYINICNDNANNAKRQLLPTFKSGASNRALNDATSRNVWEIWKSKSICC